MSDRIDDALYEIRRRNEQAVRIDVGTRMYVELEVEANSFIGADLSVVAARPHVEVTEYNGIPVVHRDDVDLDFFEIVTEPLKADSASN
jgi:hypothetical protein